MFRQSRPVIRDAVLLMMSVGFAAIILETALRITVPRPEVEKNQAAGKKTPEVNEHRLVDKAVQEQQGFVPQNGKERCRSAYYAVFLNEDSTICAPQTTKFDAIGGAPPKFMVANGVMDVASVVDADLCTCLDDGAPYQVPGDVVERITRIRYEGKDITIKKWVCGDDCQITDERR